MFCGKCGAMNSDNAEFCGECGSRFDGVKTSGGSVSFNDNQRNKKVGIIAVAAVAVLVVILAFALFGGRSYKAVVKQYVNASLSADAGEILELIPDEVIDVTLEDEDMTRKELKNELNEELEDAIEYLDRYLGDGWKFSYKIVDVEDLSGDDLDDLSDDYEDFDVKISGAKIVEVELTIKYDGDEFSQSMEIALIKIGRSWYLDVMNTSGLF